MRLLLIPLAGGVGLGPLTRCLALSHEAKIHSHEVLFICKDTFCEIVRKFGYRTHTAPTPAQYRGPKPPPFKLSYVAIALGWVEESYINSAIEAERQIIRSFRPDVIFTSIYPWTVNTRNFENSQDFLHPEDVGEVVSFIIKTNPNCHILNIELSSISEWRGNWPPWVPK